MVTIKRINVASAFRMGFWLGVGLGLISLLFLILLSSLHRPFPLPLTGGFILRQLLIGLPLAGLQFGAFLAMLAFIYNLVARWQGGLRVQVEYRDPDEKPKNDFKREVPISGGDDEDEADG